MHNRPRIQILDTDTMTFFRFSVCRILPLSQFGFLDANGPHAMSFLHTLVSCKIASNWWPWQLPITMCHLHSTWLLIAKGKRLEPELDHFIYTDMNVCVCVCLCLCVCVCVCLVPEPWARTFTIFIDLKFFVTDCSVDTDSVLDHYFLNSSSLLLFVL